jgi:F-type H+-transporting ATPase subunit b
MIAVDYTLFIQIGLFLLLWLLLARFVFRPFLRLLEQREQQTDGVRTQALDLAEEAEKLKLTYEEAIAKATHDSQATKEALRQEAMHAREKLLAETREETARFLENARREIEEEIRKGREAVLKEAGTIALQMAEKVLARKLP